MKKTIIKILVAVLVVALIVLGIIWLCSEPGAVDLEDVMDGSHFVAAPTYTSLTQVSDLTNAEYMEKVNSLFYVVQRATGSQTYDKHIVYNLYTGQVVYSKLESENVSITISLQSAYKADMIWEYVTTTDATTAVSTYASTLYQADGAVIATTAKKDAAPEIYLDLIYFDAKYYRADVSGTVAHLLDWSYSAQRIKPDTLSEDYYYEITSNTYKIYNREDLSLTVQAALPGFASSPVIAPLSDGNLFVQYQRLETADAEDYTFVKNEMGMLGTQANKYTLVTYIVDADDGSCDEIEVDFVVLYLMNVVSDYELWEESALNVDEVRNLAVIYPVENERLYTTSVDLSTVVLDDDAEIEGYLMVENDKATGTASVHAANHFVVIGISGKNYLLNEDGDVIADVTNAEVYESFVIAGGKIYDLDMNELYDYEVQNLSIHSVLGSSILFKKADGELICYANGATTTLIPANSLTHRVIVKSDACFLIADMTDPLQVKYDVYNAAGVKIATIGDADPIATINEVEQNGVIVMLTYRSISGDTVYYRLAQ